MDPAAVLGHRFPESTFEYSERDAALYALAVGACGEASSASSPASAPGLASALRRGPEADPDPATAAGELQFCAPRIISSDFQVLPTFAVIYPASLVDQILSMDSLKFDPALLLHGEHYLELFTPSLPPSARVTSSTCVAGLVDKGKAAVLEVETESRDAATGEPLCLNSASCVLRGAGGFKGRQPPGDSGSRFRSQWRGSPLPLASKPPGEPPSYSVSQLIPPTQALIYRLCGDYNPLHADPSFAAAAGFPKPILHGLCTLGYAVRALLLFAASLSEETGAPEAAVRRLRCRFLSHVFPGETLSTRLWAEKSESAGGLGGGAPQGLLRVTLFAFVVRDGKDRVVLSATVELAPTQNTCAWSIATVRSHL